ncbi:hypothetical protein Q0F98_35130 [Paenibacillus amylolyticus]|nr:hypothetical protein Q0F98_35130 [Paenibacillus amylolyticus]
MTNVMTTEARKQWSWMNEPETWSYTDQGGVLVEAKADTDFSKIQREAHSCNCSFLVHASAWRFRNHNPINR